MGFIIVIAVVLVVVGLVRALDNSTSVRPRRRTHARSAPRPAASAWTSADTYSTVALASSDWPSTTYADDDRTRNTDSTTSWDAGDSHCAPADSGSWDGEGDSGGCDSGSSD